VVEVLAVGVCGSDVHYFRHGRIGDFVVDAPLVLGHEASGRVVARGSEAQRHQVGQRVAIEPGVPCGGCTQCRTGRYNLCPHVVFLATPPVDGAFTRYLAVHEDFVHPVPDSLGDEAAALLEPLSVGVWAAQKVAVQPGDRVLVTGAGPVGVLCGMVALARGASQVTVTDVSPERLEVARRLGIPATHLAGDGPPAEAGITADVLLECSGAAAAVAGGLRALAPAGRAVLVGMSPDPEVAVPVAILQNRELTLTGTFRYASTYPAALALVRRGLVDLDALVSARLPLERAVDALEAPGHDPTVMKAVVLPGA
jgi:L-iditol 2-dehydrogenase